MATGTIRTLKLEKGFGFIRSDDKHRDEFFHVSELSADLVWDEQLMERRVQFEHGEDPVTGRARAVRVRPVD